MKALQRPRLNDFEPEREAQNLSSLDFPISDLFSDFQSYSIFSEQMRLIQKLGDGARPFTLAFPQTAPNSVLVKKCPRLLRSTGSNWLELIVVVVGCSIVGADAIVVGEEVCGVVVVVVVVVVVFGVDAGGGGYANNDSAVDFLGTVTGLSVRTRLGSC